MKEVLVMLACTAFGMGSVCAQGAEQALSEKERSIVAISMYTATGDAERLKTALVEGLEAGVTVNEEKEVMLQLYAYCGFPRSMNALAVLTELIQTRAAAGIVDTEGPAPSPITATDRVAFGGANRLQLFGRPAQGEVLTYVPALDEFLQSHLFGDIFGRDNLDWKTRELVTVSAVSVMDRLEGELRIHIAHGKHNGLTDAQIAEVLTMAQRCRNNMVLNELDEPKKTFAVDPAIRVEKVFYKNRYDITLCADVYLPAGFDSTQQYAALIVGHPFGAVKEHCSGLYAQEMARRGFVGVAFDASYMGESGGEPRLTVSPEALVEDFSATVDWLGLQGFVDRNRIGVIGICGSGGFAVAAASIDPRIRALATVSMYDMGRATRNGLGDTMTAEQRKALLAEVAEERWREAAGGEARVRFGTPEQLPEGANAVQQEFFNYYRNSERGQHPRYMGTRYTSIAALTTFYPFAQIADISPRPVLFVVGEKAHSRYFSEDAYAQAGEPKELYIVPGAIHTDLYDRVDKIPFDKLTAFFRENLQ